MIQTALQTVPETASVSPGLTALLTSAAFAPIENLGWIRVTGEDRVRWLNGMVTNNIAGLKPGEGCYNFFLNAQGRIQGDCTAWMFEEFILLETSLDRVPGLMTMLDHFIIMDDVELTATEFHNMGLLIAGPEAVSLLKYLGATSIPESEMKLAAMDEEDGETYHGHSAIVPLYEEWSGPHHIDLFKKKLVRGGFVEAAAIDLEHLRILSGTPLYGTDIRDKDLPQETNQSRALHFAKGCYLGQEIVERIRSRGQVHRTFGGFTLQGELPPAGTPLVDDASKPIGELTSVAEIGSAKFALGYIRREAIEKKLTLHYAGGTATPAALPFQLPELRA